MRDWSKRLCSTVLAATLLVSNIQPVFAFAEEAEDTGLCEHHVTHENCGYVAAVAGADCKHEHDDDCFTVNCAHVHGDCGYVAAVEGVDCDHQHDGDCGYAEAVAEVPCTCQQEEHTQDCAYAPAIPEIECVHVHGECSYVEAKSEVPCGHDCTQDEACGKKVLSCTHSHDESCGYVAAVEGKACEFVCEACAAEEAGAAAVAEVKALMEALPELEAVQAMSMEEQKAAYKQTQAAYDAYRKLAEEQKEYLPDSEEVFKTLFHYFDTLASSAGDVGDRMPDSIPPILNSVVLSATTVTAPSEIEVIVEASDDVSGVDYGYVDFECENTGKYLRCSVRKTYLDNLGNEIDYADGKLHGTLKFDQYVESGTFIVQEIKLQDVAQNVAWYYRDSDDMPETVKALQIQITNLEISDSRPPVLKEIALSAIEVTVPDEIEVIVDASDDVSGVDFGYVDFECESTGKYLRCSVRKTYLNDQGNEVNYADEKLHGTLKFDQYVESGVFVIREIKLQDVAKNVALYYRDSSDLPEAVKTLQIQVAKSEISDNLPPVLEEIALSATEITAPGEIEVVVDASDDVSGAESGYVDFECKNTGKYLRCSVRKTYLDDQGNEVNHPDGKLHGMLQFDQYVENGVFVIQEIKLQDAAQNVTWYYRDSDNMPTAVKNLQIIVQDPYGECGESAYWRFDPKTGALTISGTGYFSGFYGTASGRKYYWEDYLEDIKKIVVEEGLTQIGSHAFEGCKNATEVSIPDSITTVGYGAFTDCASLETVVLPVHIPELYLTFNGCSSLKNVTLPTAITSLNGTFMDCASLESVEIPESVTIIDTMTFVRCTALKEFTVPDQITEIGPIAFLDCTNLKKVTFEGNAPNIWEAIDDHPDGRGAFAGCTLTAYYPAGNTTWTDEVMKQYGGNITWKPYCPNGHTVVTDKSVEATCTATGLTEGKHCSACGEVLIAQTTVAAKGHNYVNGCCSRCGIAAPTSGGSTGDSGSTRNGSSTNTGTVNAGTTTRPTTQPNQNGAELSAKELEASANRNASTTIAVDGIRITFDAKAQKAIADQAAKDDIYLHYEEIREAKLNQAQKKAIKNHLSDHKGQKHVLTFSITLISGGKEIHDFKGGTATVKIPFTPNPGTKGDDYKVFFVDGNGELHPMETTYESGYLVVKLTHFSEYVVFHMPEESAEETTEATVATEDTIAEDEPATITNEPVQAVKAAKTAKTDSIGMILWIIIALCIVGIVVIGVILLRMRKKK